MTTDAECVVIETETLSAPHTPGPWEVSDLWVCEENDPGHNVGICMCEDRPEAQANARLIAAAPTMYAALKALVDPDNAPLMFVPNDAWTEDVRAAICKAEGRNG